MSVRQRHVALLTPRGTLQHLGATAWTFELRSYFCLVKNFVDQNIYRRTKMSFDFKVEDITDFGDDEDDMLTELDEQTQAR